MEYRKFGNTDLLVSEIGFGAWAIGGGAMIGTTSIGWGDSDDDVSIKAIHASLVAGINFFDTAEVYPVPPQVESAGITEEIVGEWLSTKNRDSVILATTTSHCIFF